MLIQQTKQNRTKYEFQLFQRDTSACQRFSEFPLQRPTDFSFTAVCQKQPRDATKSRISEMEMYPDCLISVTTFLNLGVQ